MTAVKNSVSVLKSVRKALFAFWILSIPMGPALAQDNDSGGGSNGIGQILDILIPDSMQMTLGGGPRYAPDYFGSDDYEWDFAEVYFLRFKDNVTVDNEGISYGLFELSEFTIGPTANIADGRNDDKNIALHGLGDVGTTFELGAFAKAQFNDRYTFRLRYRHAVKTGHHGGILDAQATARVFEHGPVSAAVNVKGTWVDKQYSKTFFGVSPEQAERSGLSEFSAGTTIRDVRGGVVVRYALSEKWALNGYAKYKYLLGDAAATPIVSDFGSREQYAVGAFASYTFTFD